MLEPFTGKSVPLPKIIQKTVSLQSYGRNFTNNDGRMQLERKLIARGGYEKYMFLAGLKIKNNILNITGSYAKQINDSIERAKKDGVKNIVLYL